EYLHLLNFSLVSDILNVVPLTSSRPRTQALRGRLRPGSNISQCKLGPACAGATTEVSWHVQSTTRCAPGVELQRRIITRQLEHDSTKRCRLRFPDHRDVSCGC